MSVPLISVYLPTHNRCSLLREAANSVLDQSLTDFELVIVNDGSTDPTEEVARLLEKTDQRVRVITLPSPVGPSHARNIAIDNCAGTYVTGLDDDDLMLPDRLSTLISAASDRHSLICSGFFLEKKSVRRRLHTSTKTIDLNTILHYNFIGNQSLMRRCDVTDIGGYDGNLLASEDYDLWTRMIERFGPALRIATPTYVKREFESVSQQTYSANFPLGAAQYLAKHKSKMSSTHIKSQRLIQIISERKPIAPLNAVTLLNKQNFPILLRYAASRALNILSRKQ